MCDLPEDYKVIMCGLMSIGERGESTRQLLLSSGGGATPGT